jgi:hypothetical protein
MSEQLLSGGGPESDPASVCPWCSAALPSGTEDRCPSCGASLHGSEASEIPGVTRIDHEALLKARAPDQHPRGLIGWLSGEYETEEPEAAPPGTLEPPDEQVRREMLRLELAALEAEVHARQVEAIVEAAEAGEIDVEAALEEVNGEEAAVSSEAAAEATASDTDDEAAAAGGEGSATEPDEASEDKTEA